MKKIYNIPKDRLIELYVVQGKSAQAICDELGIKSKTVIFRLLKKYNIEHRNSRTGTPQPNAKMYGELHHTYFYILKDRAKRKNLDFNISGEYIWELFLSQKRKCAISGLTLFLPKTWGPKTKTQMTASLDRIDSSQGYIIGNVQWIHKKINIMKMDMSNEEFITICREINDYNVPKK